MLMTPTCSYYAMLSHFSHVQLCATPQDPDQFHAEEKNAYNCAFIWSDPNPHFKKENVK